MDRILVNETQALTVPAGVNTVSIVHEWGDIEQAANDLVAGSTYNFTPNSIGIYKVKWGDRQPLLDEDNEEVRDANNNIVYSTTSIKIDIYESYSPLTDWAEYSADFPNVGTEAEFAAVERRVRHVIEVFTGQKFGPFINKTLTIQGDGGDTLEIPYRIAHFTELTDQWSEDLTDFVEVAAGEPYFLQYRDRFRRPFYQDYKRDLGTERRKQDFFTDKLDFSITGNFGWEYVPTPVSEAAKLLIDDDFKGANDLRRNGINEAQLGDFSYKLNADQWGTTGNTQADMLLADYTIMRFGNI